MIIARTEDFCTVEQVSFIVGPHTIIYRCKTSFLMVLLISKPPLTVFYVTSRFPQPTLCKNDTLFLCPEQGYKMHVLLDPAGVYNIKDFKFKGTI